MSKVSMREACTAARSLPKPGRYRHFKGGEYEVLEVARHTETGDLLAVYRSVEDPTTTWVRPVEMFSEIVERPEGTFPRFQPAPTWDAPEGSGRLGRVVLRAVIALLNRSGHDIAAGRSSLSPIVVVHSRNSQDALVKGCSCRNIGAATENWPLERTSELSAPWLETPADRSGVSA